VRQLRAAFTEVEDLPIPVIAAMDGAALGGGLELALACDLRVAGSSAIIGLTETSLAIIPGAGGTQRLPRAIGLPRAKHLVFTSKRLNAEEAERIGLVQAVAGGGKTAYDEAMVIAAAIAKNGPVALRMAKQAMNKGMQTDVATGMAIEQLCYAGVIRTEDRLEGLKVCGWPCHAHQTVFCCF
jgi:methylglutaconyl-CoA hydratase